MLLGVLDARSGEWISRNRLVSYPEGHWWAWSDYRREGPSGLQLWVVSAQRPRGYWQDVHRKLGGLLAIFPS